jgi:alanyl-tRNA synthetase
MKVPSRDVAEKAAALVKRVKELESGAQRMKAAVSEDALSGLLDAVTDAPGYRLLVTGMPRAKAAAMREAWDVVRARGVAAAVLIAEDEETGKPIFVAAGTDAAVAAGFDAGAAVRAIAAVLGGRGGGKPSMAQGGGEDASRIDEALASVRSLLDVE